MKNFTRPLFYVFVLLASISLQFCGTPKNMNTNAALKSAEPLVSYENQILPIMVESCTPCHFPDQGKKKFLDTYAATKSNIQDILMRVELPSDDPKFMPFKSKKPALTAEQVNMLKSWVAQGFPK
jgi:thioredoxin-related protein